MKTSKSSQQPNLLGRVRTKLNKMRAKNPLAYELIRLLFISLIIGIGTWHFTGYICLTYFDYQIQTTGKLLIVICVCSIWFLGLASRTLKETIKDSRKFQKYLEKHNETLETNVSR
jgi:hypothetical protein